MHECSSCKKLMRECSFRALNFALVHNMHSCIICTRRGMRAVQATHTNKMNVLCVHACSSSYTRQQNERLVHARVQFSMVIRHRSVVRTRKMLQAFLKTCRAVQLLHACVVKFKVSGTVYHYSLTIYIRTYIHTYVRTYIL